jgi:uncharacterized membrane protein
VTGLLAAIADTKALLQVVVASLVAGVGVAVAFSLVILGATRFVDLRRNERSLEAAAFGLLAALCLLASMAAVVIGLIVMASK